MQGIHMLLRLSHTAVRKQQYVMRHVKICMSRHPACTHCAHLRWHSPICRSWRLLLPPLLLLLLGLSLEFMLRLLLLLLRLLLP